MSLDASLESFFGDHVRRAFVEEGLSAGEPTASYLVRLLAAYAAQPIADRPLALRLLEALGDDVSPSQRRVQLRQIGDTSLYVSGFWADSLSGKLIDVDYYIDLGGTAYGERARATTSHGGGDVVAGLGASDVFGELAANFGRFVEVLMIVSRKTACAGGNRDVVRLYERWLRTKSRWAARRLVEIGVLAPARSTGMIQ